MTSKWPQSCSCFEGCGGEGRSSQSNLLCQGQGLRSSLHGEGLVSFRLFGDALVSAFGIAKDLKDLVLLSYPHLWYFFDTCCYLWMIRAICKWDLEKYPQAVNRRLDTACHCVTLVPGNLVDGTGDRDVGLPVMWTGWDWRWSHHGGCPSQVAWAQVVL